MRFFARGYYGIETVTVASGKTREECERKLNAYKRERNQQEPFCLVDWMFWIEGPFAS